MLGKVGPPMAIRKQDRTKLPGLSQSERSAVNPHQGCEQLLAPMKNITVPAHLAGQSRLGQSGHIKAELSDNQRKIFGHSNDCHFTTP